MAQLIGLISTVPGELAVFESVMLFLLEPYFGTVDIIRALVIFRLICYFVPFLLGFLAFILHEFEFGVNSQASSFLRGVVGIFFLLLILGVMKMLSPVLKDVHLPEDLGLLRNEQAAPGEISLLRNK